ncbi:MAG: hypothetical protein ABSD21_05325 [Rhizomicrobium sp.]|jgi:hypothetical protein
MELITDFPKYLVDFVQHLDMLHMVIGGVIALLLGVATGTIVGLFVTPVLASVVYIAVDAVLPMLHRAAPVMPAFDKALLHEAITLYVAFFVVILVVFLIKKTILAVNIWKKPLGNRIDKLNATVSRRLQRVEAGDKPIYVDPAKIDCGFLLFPKQLRGLIDVALAHEALLTNKTELWRAVKRINPSVSIYLITTNENIDPKDAILAIDNFGKYDGHSIGMDIMQLSPDGGHTLVKIYVGFTWLSSDQKIYLAAPQMILPKK